MSQNRGKRLQKYVGDYIVFDLETTGVRTDFDQIIEISAIKVQDHQAGAQFSTLVNPGRRIPPGATKVNGITDEMVKDAPPLEKVLKDFADFIGDEILIGHNIHTFDLLFLYRDAPEILGRSIANDYIDTLYLARKCLPQLKHHRLTDLAEYFDVDTAGAHRALNDCVMNQICYEELGNIFQHQAPAQSDVLCPQCGSEMIRRKGKFGEFFGCSNFPRCRGTRKIV